MDTSKRRPQTESQIIAVAFPWEMRSKNIVLLDPDLHRRADICHKMQSFDLRVEPFDSIEELASPRSDYVAVLAADVGTGIPEIIDSMAHRGYLWPLVAFCEDLELSRIVAAIRSGAVNYLQWPCDPVLVASALKPLISHGVDTVDRTERNLGARRLIKMLTPREKEVLSAMAQGLSNKMISNSLAISLRTVEAHRLHLIRKLQAINSADAIRMAVEAGLV